MTAFGEGGVVGFFTAFRMTRWAFEVTRWAFRMTRWAFEVTGLGRDCHGCASQ